MSCIDTSGACQDLSNCSNVEKTHGQCCSVCNDTKEEDNEAAGVPPAECTTSTGQKHQSGETWSESSCRNCTCGSGDITCTEEVCPQITCKMNEVQKIPLGKCCPRCAPRLVIDPPRRCLEGSILDSTNPCEKCYCRNGMRFCISQVCLAIPADCNKVVRVKGQCCLTCQSEDSSSSNNTESSATDRRAPSTTDDSNLATTTAPPTAIKIDFTELSEPTTCNYRGRTLQHRERYSAGPCSLCICIHGFVACTQHSCPQVECSPLQKLEYFPDQCCPRCVGPESGRFDFLTASVPPLVDLSLTPHEIKEEDSTQKAPIVNNDHTGTETEVKDETELKDETLDVVVEEVQKVVDK